MWSELSDILGDLDGGTVRRLHDLAQRLPDDPAEVHATFRELVTKFQLAPTVMMPVAAQDRGESLVRNQAASAGTALALLMKSLSNAVTRLLDAGVNDATDPIIRAADFREIGTVSGDFVLPQRIGYIAGLPASHPARSVPPAGVRNGAPYVVLGDPARLFFRLSEVKHLTGIVTQREEAAAADEQRRQVQEAEAERRAFAKSEAGKLERIAALEKELATLKAGTVPPA